MNWGSGYAPFACSAEQDAVLDAMINRAAEVGSDGLVVLDLDGCLFDNRPRQVRILRAWAETVGETRVLGVSEEHLQTWAFVDAFVRAGMMPDEAAEIAAAFSPFWEERFFQDDFVAHDLPFPGAPRLVRALRDTGAAVRYLTGRNDHQRPSTQVALERYGFGGAPEDLWMKPDETESDRAWKRRALPMITAGRPLVVFLDNEPHHVEFASEVWPSAHVVWMRTDHAPRADSGPIHLPQIRGFLRTTDRVAGGHPHLR